MRDLALAVFRPAARVVILVVDLGLVMGSSEVRATPSAAPPQPRPGKISGRADPEAASGAPSHHSNAPIEHESQSFLSKIVLKNGDPIDGPNPSRSASKYLILQYKIH